MLSVLLLTLVEIHAFIFVVMASPFSRAKPLGAQIPLYGLKERYLVAYRSDSLKYQIFTICELMFRTDFKDFIFS